MALAAIDRAALHRLLFARADSFGRYKLDAAALADELDLSYSNLTVVIRSFCGEGRLRQIGGAKFGRKTYQVTSPAEWVILGPMASA